ncbi:ribosome maturation factor RimP [Propioniciclava sp.]|uniref:ribosome maturation factor RimP n=1 Tax=Propioniciclava sp. TaxID=2038686 RepID=UPI0026380E68|nr:ribosome maturation factor RimP [Propioniciclava sp.]
MKQSAIAEVVAPVVEQCGLEVDRIEITSAGKRSVLRVFLDGDGPDGGGPSLDEIADATRALSAALDESPATGNAPYTLEVSSRGTSRPLTAPKHFRRNIGRLVALTLAEEKVTGRITGADDEGVTLDVDGTERRVAHPEIRKAVVQVELRKDVDLGDVGTDDDDEE